MIQKTTKNQEPENRKNKQLLIIPGINMMQISHGIVVEEVEICQKNS